MAPASPPRQADRGLSTRPIPTLSGPPSASHATDPVRRAAHFSSFFIRSTDGAGASDDPGLSGIARASVPSGREGYPWITPQLRGGAVVPPPPVSATPQQPRLDCSAGEIW